jgi:Trypsin-co-occurring domain 1
VAYTELVRIGEVEFLAQIAESGGTQLVRADSAYSFDGVRQTIEAVAGQVAEVWDKVKPDEASVEFGLSLAAKSGRLLGLLVDGGAQAALKVTLTWRAAPRPGEPVESAASAGTGETAESGDPAELTDLTDLAELAEPIELPLPRIAAEPPAEAERPGPAVADVAAIDPDGRATA